MSNITSIETENTNFTTKDLKRNFEQKFNGDDIIVVTVSNRKKSAADKPCIKLTQNTFDTQQDLMDDWEIQYSENITNEEFTIEVIGKDGLYSNYFNKLIKCNNVTVPKENIYYIDKCLGIINSEQIVPNYTFGTYTDKEDTPLNILNNMSKLIVSDERKKFDTKDWWKFVTELTGNSLHKVIQKAIDEHKQVHLVVNSIVAKIIAYELNTLLDAFTEEELFTHLRIFSNEISNMFPDELMGIDLYMLEDNFDKIVQGTKANFSKRVWYSYLHNVDEITDSPALDASKVYDWEATVFDNADNTPVDLSKALYWDNNAQVKSTTSKKQKLTKEECFMLMANEYYHGAPTFGSPARIAKLMYADDYSVNLKKITEVLQTYGKPEKGVVYTVDNMPEKMGIKAKAKAKKDNTTEDTDTVSKETKETKVAKPSSKKAQKKAAKKNKKVTA